MCGLTKLGTNVVTRPTVKERNNLCTFPRGPVFKLLVLQPHLSCTLMLKVNIEHNIHCVATPILINYMYPRPGLTTKILLPTGLRCMVQIILFPLSLHPSQHHMSIKINISYIRAGLKQGEDGATAILNLHGGCLFSHAKINCT